jgi:hypothetical protein
MSGTPEVPRFGGDDTEDVSQVDGDEGETGIYKNRVQG